MNLKYKALIASAVLLALLAVSHIICLADGGNEGPDAKTTRSSLIYPNSQAKPDAPLDRVTNDGLDRVKAYYQKLLGPYDIIEPLSDQAGFRKGFAVIYRVHYQGTAVAALLEFARLEVTMPDSVGFKSRTMGYEHMLPQPLVQLRSLIGRFGHTREDFDKLFNQYQWLRFIQSWDPSSDGPMIIRKYHDQVYGPMPKNAPKAKKGDAAAKAELAQKRKKMKDLKASGDMAAMMALAQEMQAQAAGTSEGEAGMEIMQQQMEGLEKDSWGEWTDCLSEMAQAARWVRLEYSQSSSGWGQNFWQTATPAR